MFNRVLNTSPFFTRDLKFTSSASHTTTLIQKFGTKINILQQSAKSCELFHRVFQLFHFASFQVNG